MADVKLGRTAGSLSYSQRVQIARLRVADERYSVQQALEAVKAANIRLTAKNPSRADLTRALEALDAAAEKAAAFRAKGPTDTGTTEAKPAEPAITTTTPKE